jgi:hypothetical protein
MDKQQQDKMINFIIENKIKLGDTLQDIINVATSELTKGSTNQEEFQFHTAVKEEASARLRKETRSERFPEVVSKKQDEWNEEMEKRYWEEQVPDPFATSEELIPPPLSDEEMTRMLQSEYDRMAYLDPSTDNINI